MMLFQALGVMVRAGYHKAIPNANDYLFYYEVT